MVDIVSNVSIVCQGKNTVTRKIVFVSSSRPWGLVRLLTTAPGLAIGLSVLGFNLLGDGLAQLIGYRR